MFSFTTWMVWSLYLRHLHRLREELVRTYRKLEEEFTNEIEDGADSFFYGSKAVEEATRRADDIAARCRRCQLPERPRS